MMKKILLIMLFLFLLMSGCVYQAELRPEYNETDVWICEKPYIELCWSKSDGNIGTIIDFDTQYEIIHKEDYGALMWVYTYEAKPFKNTDVPEKFWVFKGDVNYEKESLSIKVENDFKNIFGGELPTLHFKRYKKDDLPERKQEE